MKTGVIPPIDMSLDACVEYLATDEILEVTPSLYRMAKNPDLAKKAKGGKKQTLYTEFKKLFKKLFRGISTESVFRTTACA